MMKILSVNEEQILYVDAELNDNEPKKYRTYVKPIGGRIWEVLNGDKWELFDDAQKLKDALDGNDIYNFHMWVYNRKIKMYEWTEL